MLWSNNKREVSKWMIGTKPQTQEDQGTPNSRNTNFKKQKCRPRWIIFKLQKTKEKDDFERRKWKKIT